jgi:hypothetical protein
MYKQDASDAIVTPGSTASISTAIQAFFQAPFFRPTPRRTPGCGGRPGV